MTFNQFHGVVNGFAETVDEMTVFVGKAAYPEIFRKCHEKVILSFPRKEKGIFRKEIVGFQR